MEGGKGVVQNLDKLYSEYLVFRKKLGRTAFARIVRPVLDRHEYRLVYSTGIFVITDARGVPVNNDVSTALYDSLNTWARRFGFQGLHGQNGGWRLMGGISLPKRYLVDPISGKAVPE